MYVARWDRLKNKQIVKRDVTRYMDDGSHQHYRERTEEERGTPKRLTARKVIACLSIYLSIALMVSGAEFVMMEAVKNPSFSLGSCPNMLKATDDPTIRAQVIQICNQAYDAQLAQAQMGRQISLTSGWVLPFNWLIYVNFFEVNIRSLKFNQQMFQLMVEAGVQPYKPANKTIRMCDTFTYESKTLQFKETDVKGLTEALAQAAKDGFSFKAEYNTKINYEWYTVIMMQKTIDTAAPCAAQN
jgi:hypothetical protein